MPELDDAKHFLSLHINEAHMKHLSLALSLGVLASPSLFAAEGDPLEVKASVSKIYIPQGFDDNDNVEVILRGAFPDTCHRVGKSSAVVDKLTKTVSVQASAFKYPGKACTQSIMPFIETVKLGVLPEGTYQLSYGEKESQINASFSVERRKTESPDDFLYATVENASLDVNPESGKQALKLRGQFPFFFIGCMVMKEVRTTLDSNNILVVLPIAELVNDETCQSQPADRSFEYTAGLSAPVQGEGLVHVRTLNGNSVNNLIDVK